MNPASPLLELNAVTAAYGEFQALFGVSLAVYPGEIVTLIGANGAGKTTTLRVVSGLLGASGGRMRLNGQDVTGLPAHRMVELGVSHVPEARQLFPFMTVEENLRLGAYSQRSRARLRHLLEEQLEFFPKLRDWQSQLAGTLSGGEQQMVAIARGLMADPALLLLDEPSLGLSPKVTEETFERIQRIGQSGITVLIVEQNVVDGLSISARGYVVEHGTTVLEGEGRALLADERIRQAYLGL